MLNILRMDFYRIVHGKSLWIILGVVLAIGIFSAFFLALASSPEFLATVSGDSSQDYTQAAATVSSVTQGLTQLSYIGNVMIKGGSLPTLFVIFVAIFLASEFEGGFSKNLFTVQSNRLVFLAARCIVILALSLVFVAFGLAVALASAAVANLDVTASPFPDILLWYLLASLNLAGFGMLSAIFVWLTRKMAVGIVVGLVFANGIVTSLLQLALLLAPNFKHLADFTLFSCTQSLGLGLDAEGGLGSLHIFGVSLAFFAVSTLISALVLKKKDV